MSTLNYAAILVAAGAYLLIGMALYSKDILGNRWMKLVKKNRQQHEAGSYAIAIIAAVLMGTVMSIIASFFPATVWGGVITGFLAWAGFVATTSINEVIWEGRPPVLFFINNAHHLLGMIVMGIIISVWV